MGKTIMPSLSRTQTLTQKPPSRLPPISTAASSLWTNAAAALFSSCCHLVLITGCVSSPLPQHFLQLKRLTCKLTG